MLFVLYCSLLFKLAIAEQQFQVKVCVFFPKFLNLMFGTFALTGVR